MQTTAQESKFKLIPDKEDTRQSKMIPDKDTRPVVPLFNNYERDSSNYRTEIMYRTIAILLHDKVLLHYRSLNEDEDAILGRLGWGDDPELWNLNDPWELKNCLNDCIGFVDVNENHRGPAIVTVPTPSWLPTLMMADPGIKALLAEWLACEKRRKK